MLDPEESLAEVRDRLQVGITKEEAIEILSSNKIEHSYLSFRDLDRQGLESIGVAKEIMGRIHGVIRDVEKGLFTTTSYTIEIDVGRKDQVIDVRIVRVLTGP